jgi:hypothetical protein
MCDVVKQARSTRVTAHNQTIRLLRWRVGAARFGRQALTGLGSAA